FQVGLISQRLTQLRNESHTGRKGSGIGKVMSGQHKRQHRKRERNDRNPQVSRTRRTDRKRRACERDSEEDAVGSMEAQFRKSRRIVRDREARAEIAVVVGHKRHAIEVVSKPRFHKQIRPQFEIVLKEEREEFCIYSRERISEALHVCKWKRQIGKRQSA